MTVLVVDLLELVEVDHEDEAVDLVAARFGGLVDDVLLELCPVIEVRKVIDGDLVSQRNDIDVKDHEGRCEAEDRRRKPKCLDDSENGDHERIDPADQILSPDGVVFAPESPYESPDTAYYDIEDRNAQEENVICHSNVSIIVNYDVREEQEQYEHYDCVDHRRDQDVNAELRLLDVLFALGELNIYKPVSRDQAEHYGVEKIKTGYRKARLRDEIIQDLYPSYIADVIKDVGKTDIDEYELLGLSAGRRHLFKDHHHEDDDTYDVRLDVEKRIISYHIAIIASENQPDSKYKNIKHFIYEGATF